MKPTVVPRNERLAKLKVMNDERERAGMIISSFSSLSPSPPDRSSARAAAADPELVRQLQKRSQERERKGKEERKSQQ